MHNNKVLISSFYNRSCVAHEIERLGKSAGIIICQEGRTLTEEELQGYLKGVDAVIAAEEPYNRNVFRSSPRLAMIARDGVGLDSIDIPCATEFGVIVNNAPVVHESVADLTIGLIISVIRKIRIGDMGMRTGKWSDRDSYLCPDVNGKILGLLGFGRVARAVAQRAAAFNMKIFSYDPYADAVSANRLDVRLVEMDELLSTSDVISIHVPLTPQTHDIINDETITRMKDGVYIINTARGGMINEPALIKAIKCGTIAGAGLDVVCSEPSTSDNPLFKLDNIVFTPHVGSDTTGTFARVYASAVTDILMLFEGKTPRHIVNPEVLKS